MNKAAYIINRFVNSFFAGTKKSYKIIGLAVLLMGLSAPAFAQVQKEERQAPPMGQLPQEQNQLAITYEDEIKEDELPEAVISSLHENYPEYEISEVFRGSDGSYKVKLGQKEKTMTAYYNPGGEFLRITNEDQEESINDDWR